MKPARPARRRRPAPDTANDHFVPQAPLPPLSPPRPAVKEKSNYGDNERASDFTAAFILFMTVRLASAMYTCVADCDETYNYWEPLHYMLYGFGQQTWEYAPGFALRSWAYLLPLRLVALVHAFLLRASVYLRLQSAWTKIDMWRLLKVTMGYFCGRSEGKLFLQLRDSWGRGAAGAFLVFTLSSAGTFVASTALLPSSTCMILQYRLLAAWIGGQGWRLGIFLAVLATFGTGWPFVAVLHVPIAIVVLIWQTLLGQRLWTLALWAAGTSAVLAAVTTVIDSHYYGRWTSPTLNIVWYNVLAKSEGRSDELYGVEPWTYYVKNLALNTSPVVMALLACAFPVALGPQLVPRGVAVLTGALAALLVYVATRSMLWAVLAIVPAAPFGAFFGYVGYLGAQYLRLGEALTHPLTIALPGLLWLAVMFSKPHKEERFLYPAYPSLFAGAAGTLGIIGGAIRTLKWPFRFGSNFGWYAGQLAQRAEDEEGDRLNSSENSNGNSPVRNSAAVDGLNGSGNSKDHRRLAFWMRQLYRPLLIASGVMGVCRIRALVRYYGAPCEVFKEAYLDLHRTSLAGVTLNPRIPSVDGYVRERSADSSANGGGGGRSGSRWAFWKIGGDAGGATSQKRQGQADQRQLQAAVEDAMSKKGTSRKKAPGKRLLCVGGEWYRYPSSFYLPDAAVELAYLPSNFKGQLPQPFAAPLPAANASDERTSSGPLFFRGVISRGTSATPALPFNDLNKEEPSRYYSLSDCDYVVEMVPSDGPSSPRAGSLVAALTAGGAATAGAGRERWEMVHSSPMLDVDATRWYDRALYLPMWSEGRVAWASLGLYRKMTTT